MTRRSIQNFSLTVLMVALIAGISGFALAGKPGGGGGGGGTVPSGTIFFLQGDYSYTYRSMKPDGTAKADTLVLHGDDGAVAAEPSYQLHDGRQWFVTGIGSWDTGIYEDELFAVADDGDVMPLGITVAYYVGGRWGKDDSFFSFEAIVDGPEGLSAGIFVADVDWSLGTPVMGEFVKVLNVNLHDVYYPDIYIGDWSPSGDELVYTRESPQADGYSLYSLEVVKFLTDGTTETRSLVSESFADAPHWSPDGTRIAYRGDTGIWTIEPDGSNAVKVSSPNVNQYQYHYDPSWSPDSQYLVFTQGTKNKYQKGQLTTYSYDILRISATGGGVTNLTSDTDSDCFSVAWR